MHFFHSVAKKVIAYSSTLLFITLVNISYAIEISDNSIPYKFERISIEQGLSQSFVYDMVQDKHGFIWIATQDGLNRYDGQQFVHYRNDNTNPKSIANNFIRKLFIDNEDNLWIGTNNGLSRYNEVLDNFDNFFHHQDDVFSLADNQIWDIFQDKQGSLIISSQSNLHRFDKKNQHFSRVIIRNLLGELNEIKTIFQDKKGNYWLGTFDKGILLTNDSLTYAASIQQENKWDLIIEANALYDAKIIKDQYWLATDNGVYVISEDYKILKHYTEKPLHSSTETVTTKESIAGLATNKTAETKTNIKANKFLSSNIVRSLESLNDNTVWLGTLNGLNTIDLASDTVTVHLSQPHINSLSSNRILTVFKDKAENLWLGTNGQGLNKFNQIQLIIKHGLFDYKKIIPEITDFTETNDGKIWFISDNKTLNYIEKKQIYSIPFPQNYSSNTLMADKERIWLFFEDLDLNLPIKLFYYDSRSEKFIENSTWQAKLNQYHSLNIQSLILVDKKIWFINQDQQLASFDLVNNTFNHYPSPTFNQHTVAAFTDDKKGNLWLLTENQQLFTFNIKQQQFNNSDISIPKTQHFKQISTLAVSNNYIWLGSENNGLALINKQDKQLKTFNNQNGLVHNSITDILIDDKETAWIASNQGVNNINPKNLSIQLYDKDALPNNGEFINKSGIITTNKQVYFGSINGYISFAIEEIKKIKQQLTKPVINNILLANKVVPINTPLSYEKNNPDLTTNEFTITKSANHLQQLELAYRQSQFSLEFISPNSKIPSQINYRYRLLGLDDNWIDAGKNNQRATYTNLNHGDYIFQVQAYDTQQQQESDIKSLNITILPPWWLSPTAILTYILCVAIFIGYIIVQIRNKRLYNSQIKLSEERLKLSLWGSGDEMWDWYIQDNKMYRSNIWGLLNFPQDGTRNMPNKESNIHQQDMPRIRQSLNQHFMGHSDHFEATYRVKDKDNGWIWVLDRGKIVERDAKQQPLRMTGTLKDISKIRRNDERLKLFAKCFENISDAVVIYDRKFIVVDVNQAYENITGISKAQMFGTSLVFNHYSKAFNLSVKKQLITRGHWQKEIKNIHTNGRVCFCDYNITALRDEDQNTTHFVAIFSDITQRKKAEASLIHLANTDTLTHLHNRSFFQRQQQRLVAEKIPHALLVVDLDNFKKVNDSLGHEVGDALLCQLSKRIETMQDKVHAIYRLGGDEFALLIKSSDKDVIIAAADQVLNAFIQPIKLNKQEIVLYSSIGIALYPEDGNSQQELLKNADTAMYFAKKYGGNKYQFYHSSMNNKAIKRLQMERLIRYGLKTHCFCVYYQPKIEIKSGTIYGMEALVRFKTPKNNMLKPDSFISISEDTGQIIEIGEQVLRQACYATKKWVELGVFHGRVAVNLSAVQFTQPNLVEMIKNILIETDLDARYLELEITEGTVMDSPKKAIAIMEQIKEMGIHLSLDDFGTGYSSLAYLKKFPLDTLKIDKAFVDDIEVSVQGRNMVATIVTIAHNMNMQVVAEGVENNRQLSYLAGLRCEQLQGYLYSKPLNEQDFTKYLLSYQISSDSKSFR